MKKTLNSKKGKKNKPTLTDFKRPTDTPVYDQLVGDFGFDPDAWRNMPNRMLEDNFS